MARQAVTGRRAVLLSELSTDWRGNTDGGGTAAVHRGARLVLPLSVRDQVLAVVALGRREDAPRYTRDDQDTLDEIAARVAPALDPRRRARSGCPRCSRQPWTPDPGAEPG
jgi:GAF domain-containing protein